MEEAYLASRHVCKLCNKSFPCGRSLGGHMRSHLTNNSAETHQKQSRTKLQLPKNYSAGSFTNTEDETDLEAGNPAGYGYGLRKNPKKTPKLEFLDEESSLHDKFCRECGKGFQSWKALFGHMKCHSERVVSSSQEVEELDSHMDSQSRRRTRNMGRANSTSFSFATDCSSEIEQEQEVAISLMMLSRDVANWVGFNSPTESSDNNSKFLQAPSLVESKTSVSNASELVKSNKLKGKFKLDSDDHGVGSKNFIKKTISDFLGAKICKKPKKRGKFECDICRKIFDSYQALGGHRASHKKLKPSCFSSTMEGSESSAESKLSKPYNNGGQSEQEIGSRLKKSKHKCPICEKVFASGQALGGHKRSHLVNSSEGKKRQKSEETEEEVQEIREFLDLNLPAPVDIPSLKPWWVKQEALVGFQI